MNGLKNIKVPIWYLWIFIWRTDRHLRFSGTSEIACPVIFTTAYDEYALKAFKVNSVDYLLKPIGAEDVRNALEKAGAFSYGDRRTGVRRRYTRINPDVETTGELQNSFSGSPKGR